MNLYVVKYKGDDYRGVNENHYLRFQHECGLRPVEILDEPSMEYVVDFLETYPFEGDVILHFQTHGFDDGITKLAQGKSNIGERKSLISWGILVELFNQIADKCTSLHVNLGTTCFSDRITPHLINQKFNLLISHTDVTDPVSPQKLNKEFVLLSKEPARRLLTFNSELEFILKPTNEILF